MKKLRLIFAELISEIGDKDKDLVVMVGDISHGILQPFAKKNPTRYYNIGICEPTIVNMASGLSHVGMTTVVHTIAPFLIERSYEQIKLDFGYQKRSINLISVGGSFDYAQLGCSHHCYSDVAILNQFKDANIFLPTNENELRTLFKSQYKKKNINYFRLSEQSNNFPKRNKIIPGKANIIKRGSDLTIVFAGSYYDIIKEAINELAEKNISVELIHIHTFEPFDYEAVKRSIKKTKKILSVEELYFKGGLLSKCLELLAQIDGTKNDYIAVKDFIRDYGTHEQLCKKVGLTTDTIYNKALKLFKN